MTGKNNQKTMLRALRGETLETPPIWLMRQAGRYLDEYRAVRKKAPNFLTFCYTPELAIEVTLQPIDLYGFDAAILFSDILVIPDGLGQDVQFKEGIGPVLEPLKTRADIDALSVERAGEHLSPVMQSVKGIASALNDQTALIGFAGAPWTVALYMVQGRGGSEGELLRRWSYEDPAAIDALMEKLVDSTTAYLNAQIAHGAEIVQIFDSWAGLVSDGWFERWITGPTRKIVDGVRDAHPGVPIIGFPRNAGPRIEAYLRETGVDGVGIDAGVPLGWAKERLQPQATVQGNLDNQLLVVGGEMMDQAIDRICDTLSGGPFIFNLGHGIVPETPRENVQRLVDRVRGHVSNRNS